MVPIKSSLLTITLHFSVIRTPVYNDTTYPVPFVTLKPTSTLQKRTLSAGKTVFRRVSVKSEKRLLASSCLSSGSIPAPTGRIFVKFDTVDFYGYMLRSFRFGLKKKKDKYRALYICFILTAATYVTQQYTECKSVLPRQRFPYLHCYIYTRYAKTPQCYVIRAVPTLLLKQNLPPKKVETCSQ